jgi:Phage ABA sandwich domain
MPVKDEVLRTVRDLAAGREMDREIGQRVMGLPSDSLAPAYSSDIAAAWSVVEKLVRADDLYFGAPHYKSRRQSLGPLGYPVGTECWYCVINSKTFNKVVICADSAALAICRAALVWARTTELAPQETPPP